MPEPSPVDVQAVLAQEAFMRALARSLLTDAGAVDDTVQRGLWRAVESPPARPGALRAFVRAIVTRLAANERRAARRRARHEQAAARDERLPSAAEIAEQAELRGRVAAAVVALDEPYRTTIWLRYYEDLPMDAVARRMGVPRETARTRLRRGLDRLRAQLRTGDGDRWARALVACAAGRSTAHASTLALGATMPAKKTVLAAAVLAGALLVAIPLVLSTRTVAPPLGNASAAAASVDAAARAAVAAGGGRAADGRTAVGGRTVRPLAGSPLRVITAGTREPIAGAEVVALRGEDLPDGVHWNAEDEAPLAVLRAHGQRIVADGRGELRLPTFARELWVGGAADQRGHARLVGQGPFVLELARRDPLRLQVRDARATPCAGVPVMIALRISDGRWAAPWTSVTGMDGEAVVDDASWIAGVARQTRGAFFAALDVPLHPGVATPLALQPLPDEPIVLTLPATGRVRVELVQVPPALLRDVRVSVGQPPEDEGGTAPDDASGMPTGARPAWMAADGSVTFPFVGLGLRLFAGASLPDGVSATTTFDGPRRAGDTVTVALRLYAGHDFATATVQDEDAVPLHDVDVLAEVRCRENGRKSSSGGRRHVQHGRLYVPLADGGRDVLSRTLLLTHEGTSASAEVALPLRVDAGGHDLGVVTLRRPPFVAAGQIVDAAGAPVADARIGVIRRAEKKSGKGTWAVAGLPAAKTDANGRFEVRGQAVPGQHALTVDGSGFLRTPEQPFALGANDLRLVLVRAGGLTGRVRLDEGIAEWMLTVRAQARAEEGATMATLDDGRFELSPLAPGPVHLTFSAHGVGVLHERDVDVPEGVPADIGEIDLRGALHRIAFDVVDAEGQPLEHAWALAVDRDASAALWEGVPLEKGHAALLARMPAMHLLVRAKGPHCASFVGVRDGARLVMPPPAEIEITVPEDAVLALDEDERLVASVVPEAGRGRIAIRSEQGDGFLGNGSPWPTEERAVELTGGLARLRVPGPGVLRVLLNLSHRGGSAPIPGLRAPTVDVAFPWTPQRVHVPLTPDLVAGARALLRSARRARKG